MENQVFDPKLYIKMGFTRKGKQIYQHKITKKYTVENKKLPVPQEVKDFAVEMYLEGLGFQAIGRLLHFSQMSIMRWVKAASQALDNTTDIFSEITDESVVQMDEMWHFVKKKDGKSGCGLSSTN
jgi:hypothetical protein